MAAFPKIYSLVVDSAARPLFEINYSTGLSIRLKREVVYGTGPTKGVVNTVNYYTGAVVDPTTGVVTYTNLVVCEHVTYTRNSQGDAISQRKEIIWICDDETEWPETKILEKFYNPNLAIAEGIIRRQNILRLLKPEVPYFLVVFGGYTPTDARDAAITWALSFSNDMALFELWQNNALFNNVRDDVSTTWLNLDLGGQTIRQYILNAINLWEYPIP